MTLQAKTKPICQECGSEDITKSISFQFSTWDTKTQTWDEQDAGDTTYNCGQCAEDVDIIDVPVEFEPRYGCPNCGQDCGIGNRATYGTTCLYCGGRGIIEWTNNPTEEAAPCTECGLIEGCHASTCSQDRGWKVESHKQTYGTELTWDEANRLQKQAVKQDAYAEVRPIS